MNPTSQSILQQLHISDWNIRLRKECFGLLNENELILTQFQPTMQKYIDGLVEEFYKHQTSIDEVALLINDADTLERLKQAQKHYILSLFAGDYEEEYVKSRLRIGIVHKRIGVSPFLYLSGIQQLKHLINQLIEKVSPDDMAKPLIESLDKLILFDVSYVFDTYINSLVTETTNAKKKIEQYASSLEEKIQERTQQIELLSQTDNLTTLLNPTPFIEALQREFNRHISSQIPVSLIAIEIENFAKINETHGHQQGNVILEKIGTYLRKVMHENDIAGRIGNDQLSIALSNCDEDKAIDFCKKLVMDISTQTGTFVNIGSATTGPDYYCSPKDLIQAADSQLYLSKRHHESFLNSVTINDMPSQSEGDTTPLKHDRTNRHKQAG